MRNETDKYRDVAMGPGMEKISLGRRTFSSFAVPAYRLYFISMTGQWASMNMEIVTRSLLIYRLTGSAALLGAMSLANSLPMLFLSLFGGVIADRVVKKYVLIAGMAGSALVSLSIALTLTLGYLSPQHAGSWWVLVVASLFKGTIQGLMMPSRQAIIPEIVSQEQVMNAMALNSLGMSSLRLLAPAAAGFLIDYVGFEAVYYVVTGLFVMGTIVVIFLPRTGTMSIRGRGALADIREGFRYIGHETTVLALLLFTLLVIVLSMPYMAMLPIFADDILKRGATGMGILMSLSGIGAISGSLILASLPDKKRGAILLSSSLVLGVALAAFAFSRSWPLSLGLMVFVGLGQSGRQTLGSALLQTYTDAEYLGRVMSISMMDFGLSSFGSFFVGLLSESIGAPRAIGGFAAVLALISIAALVFIPRLRKLD